MKMEDNAFNDLPLLLAVPRAAQLLGISRAAAYPTGGLRRLASPPARRPRVRSDRRPSGPSLIKGPVHQRGFK
jgi:hypothetical protein